MVVAQPLQPMQGWEGEGAAPEPVRLAIMPAEATVAAGGAVELAVLIHNAGSASDHYLLDIAGVPAGWATIDAPFFSLAAGGMQRVAVTVRPPASAAPTPSGAPLRLTVRATADGALAMPGLTSAALAVRAPERAVMELDRVAAAGPEAIFHVTFHNPTSTPAPVALVVDDGGAGLRVRIAPDDALQVPPRGQAPLTVRVRPPRRAPLSPRVYDLVFRALDVRAPAPEDAIPPQHARFTYVPQLAPGQDDDSLDPAPRHRRELSLALVIGAPVALAVAVAATALHGLTTPTSHRTATTVWRDYPAPVHTATQHSAVLAGAPTVSGRGATGAGPTSPATPTILTATPAPSVSSASVTLHLPVIGGFTLRHDRPGQPYRLSWGTHGALRVTLDGRQAALTGHYVLRGTLRTRTYLLAAVNDVGWVTARVRVVVPAAPPISRTYTVNPQP